MSMDRLLARIVYLARVEYIHYIEWSILRSSLTHGENVVRWKHPETKTWVRSKLKEVKNETS